MICISICFSWWITVIIVGRLSQFIGLGSWLVTKNHGRQPTPIWLVGIEGWCWGRIHLLVVTAINLYPRPMRAPSCNSREAIWHAEDHRRFWIWLPRFWCRNGFSHVKRFHFHGAGHLTTASTPRRRWIYSNFLGVQKGSSWIRVAESFGLWNRIVWIVIKETVLLFSNLSMSISISLLWLID